MNKRIVSSFASLALIATVAMAAPQQQYGQRGDQRDHGEQRNGDPDRYDRQVMADQEAWAWRYDNLNLSWSQRRQISSLTRQFRRDDDNLRSSILRERAEYRESVDRGRMDRAEQLRQTIFRQQHQLAERRGWERERFERVLNPDQRAQFESFNGGREGYHDHEHQR